MNRGYQNNRKAAAMRLEFPPGHYTATRPVLRVDRPAGKIQPKMGESSNDEKFN